MKWHRCFVGTFHFESIVFNSILLYTFILSEPHFFARGFTAVHSDKCYFHYSNNFTI